MKLAPLAPLVLSVLLGSGATAAADQHRDANVHQWWTLARPAYNIDQAVTLRAMHDSTYVALVVGYEHTSEGAYMGLQQLADGTRIARFSIWSSTAATPSAGATCRDFDGEGVGKTCEIPFSFQLDHPYRYRMWRLADEGDGSWWGAWIIDDVTHVETAIGEIRAPAAAGDIDSADTFDEYFGDALPCDRVPASAGDVAAPTLDDARGVATASTRSIGACSGGRVTSSASGIRIELGRGKPSSMIPSASRSLTEPPGLAASTSTHIVTCLGASRLIRPIGVRSMVSTML